MGMWHPVFTHTVVEATHMFCYFLVAYYFPFSACIHFELRNVSSKEIFSSKVQVTSMYFREKSVITLNIHVIPGFGAFCNTTPE